MRADGTGDYLQKVAHNNIYALFIFAERPLEGNGPVVECHGHRSQYGSETRLAAGDEYTQLLVLTVDVEFGRHIHRLAVEVGRAGLRPLDGESGCAYDFHR